jgi:choline kinase
MQPNSPLPSSANIPEQAIILAAGTGSRLGPFANGKPKCLLPIGNRTLLELQIQTYLNLGVKEVAVVVGYRKELIEPVVSHFSDCRTIENPYFAETNSLYSLWQARDWIRGSFACSNADVVAHPDIFARILGAPGTSLGFDAGSGQDEEHMKVEVADGRALAIGKQLPADRTHGENVGILSFDADGSSKVLPLAEQIIQNGGEQRWVPTALHHMAATRAVEILAVDITGLPWAEIDFPADLEFARHQIWPRISAPCIPESKTAEAQSAI